MLAEALMLAQAQGYVRVFADEGPAMAALLRRVEPRRGQPASPLRADYVHRILSAIEMPGVEGAVARATGRALLTERELEVLHLLAAGHRNREIADELVVTVDTVKKHITHIFEKLDVISRTQAMARARELSLLP
jgi:LuxR family maltose regulon positive regulatory protein